MPLSQTLRSVRRAVRWLVVVYVLASIAAGIVLAEWTLHPPRNPITHSAQVVAIARTDYAAAVTDVSIVAADGIVLRAWYVRPQRDNGNAVVLLHGVADNREGVAGYARIFLARGYRVLLPDARAHGESGGALATYGLKETGDIHRWVSWLYDHDAPKCVYGLGESMGAALILESLASESRFCAVVAESAFSTFREVAYDRIGSTVGLGPWFGRTVGRLPIEMAFAYANFRYGLDLAEDNPVAAIAGSRVPVLLIHGLKDDNILPRHSQELFQSAQQHAGTVARP